MTDQGNARVQVPGLLRVFVYGTLKRGMRNHERFCAGALSIEEGVVRGRLYETDSGLLVLQVPETDILAHGTADPLADVATLARFEAWEGQHPNPHDKPRTRRGWGLSGGNSWPLTTRKSGSRASTGWRDSGPKRRACTAGCYSGPSPRPALHLLGCTRVQKVDTGPNYPVSRKSIGTVVSTSIDLRCGILLRSPQFRHI